MEHTSVKSQFDAALGGDVEIPTTMTMQPFVNARIDEIEALTKLIGNFFNTVFSMICSITDLTNWERLLLY